MTEQKDTIVVQQEDKAPELPKSDPPADDDKPAEAPAATENAETKPAEEPKKTSGVARRFTFNRPRWGKSRDTAEGNGQLKEPEAPKDPKEDVLGWIGQQIPHAVHKVNYLVMEWVAKVVDEGNEVPAPAAAEEAPAATEGTPAPATQVPQKTQIPGKEGMATKNQFMHFFKNDQLLAKFANKLQPGAIELAQPEENADAAKQKEVQQTNIQKFVEWVNTQTGKEGDKALTSADILEKGKAGFSNLFDSIWALALKAQDKFQKDGIDVDAVVNAANQVVGRNIIQTILGFFRRARPVANTENTTAETKANGETAQGEQTTEQKTEEQCVKVETTQAVAAN